jgi:hypothetical protein
MKRLKVVGSPFSPVRAEKAKLERFTHSKDILFIVTETPYEVGELYT